MRPPCWPRAAATEIIANCRGVNLDSNRLKECLSRNQDVTFAAVQGDYLRRFDAIQKRIAARVTVANACTREIVKSLRWLDQGDQQVDALPGDGKRRQPQLHSGDDRCGVSVMRGLREITLLAGGFLAPDGAPCPRLQRRTHQPGTTSSPSSDRYQSRSGNRRPALRQQVTERSKMRVARTSRRRRSGRRSRPTSTSCRPSTSTSSSTSTRRSCSRSPIRPSDASRTRWCIRHCCPTRS